MYKIKTKLAVYCLAYFLPVRMPETGVRYHTESYFPRTSFILYNEMIILLLYPVPGSSTGTGSRNHT